MCIDLKSFYASVECVERGLDPLTTNLVVADVTRTEKTICLAVSPSLKSLGLPGRARLFEVVQKVRNINYERKQNCRNSKFSGKSYNSLELNKNKNLELDYIVAIPRMELYMKYSANIYKIYLKYLDKCDIHIYSIDEVFCDITNYLNLYKLTEEQLATKIIKDIYDTTGITATCGIGTNLYLAKVAMDIVAKHKTPNEFGVRIASLDEKSYRKELWAHKPLTDFWRVGRGYAKKLEGMNIYTMGDIALLSLKDEFKLYKMFGVNAELLIDHAWGYESCSIEAIKKYKPLFNSISKGQVLHCPYNYESAKLIVREMTDQLCLNLTSKNLLTNSITLYLGYDVENLSFYDGDIVKDFYGRNIPKPSHGTVTLDHKTSSFKTISQEVIKLYEKIANKNLFIKRINISANFLENKENVKPIHKQYDIFSLSDDFKEQLKSENEDNEIQNIVLDIKKRYGKNSILRGMDLEKGGTTIERNNQIGGHRR